MKTQARPKQTDFGDESFPRDNGPVIRKVIIATVVVAAVVVGIFAGWQLGVAVIFLAVLVFGVGYTMGVGMDATTRWSSALYGDDPDDANHWSRTGGRRRR
jgi:hypothetical protein